MLPLGARRGEKGEVAVVQVGGQIIGPGLRVEVGARGLHLLGEVGVRIEEAVVAECVDVGIGGASEGLLSGLVNADAESS